MACRRTRTISWCAWPSKTMANMSMSTSPASPPPAESMQGIAQFARCLGQSVACLSFVWRRLLAPSILLLVISSASAADDTVYIAGPASKPGVQKQLGKIADYTGRELRLVVDGGQERKFPAGRVVRIEYTK